MVARSVPTGTRSPAAAEYPESDGKPLAETDVHARCIIDTRAALENHFAGDPAVYVSGNLLLYYEEGDPTLSVAPDVSVVRGVPKRSRRTYKLWEEGRAPNWVLEVTSRSTRWEDTATKRGLYQVLGVCEYFLFDPLGEYLHPPLQGLRLIDREYRDVSPTDQGRLASDTLQLELAVRDGELRFFDPRRGDWLLTPAESESARLAAQAEVMRLRAELARLRPSP